MRYIDKVTLIHRPANQGGLSASLQKLKREEEMNQQNQVSSVTYQIFSEKSGSFSGFGKTEKNPTPST